MSFEEATLDDSAVRQQLEKILAHSLFHRSERIGRFLRLVVERELDGRGGELKEYLIGLEVFDREQSFDPRIDPIVRVEARRLRSKLKDYYEGDGRENPVVIELVPGSYAPRIRVSCRSGSPDVTTSAVLPFVNLGPDPEGECFCNGLTQELIHALTNAPGMRLVAWNSGDRQDVIATARQLKVATLLKGSVSITGASLRVRSHLIDVSSGVYIQSETFDRELGEVFAIQEELAHAISELQRKQTPG